MKRYSKLFVLIIINLIIFSYNTHGYQQESLSKTLSSKDFEPIEVWNKTFGGEDLDWGWSVQETSDGGLIIAGETVSFGSGGFDSWLIKTDCNGNETWNKTYGGTAKDGSRSVQQTNDGGYILGGYADSYGYPGHDAWFIKTDNNGNEEWDSVFGGIQSDGTFKVMQTNDEGFIGVGYADSFGAGSHDLWVIKTDEYGNEQWNKTFGTADWDTGYSIKQCNDMGYLIIGTTLSYGSGNQDAWLIKTDVNGTEEWNETYGGTDNDWGSNIVIKEDGFFITGDTRSFGSGGYDIWLIKTDLYGNEQWKIVYGDPLYDETGYSLIETSDGGFAIIGTKTSFSTELTDIWLIKTDNNGHIQWNITLDGGNDEWGYSVDETSDGGYIIAGRTNSYGNGNYDLWLIKVEIENFENQPPAAPVVNGSSEGYIGYEQNFTISAIDPDSDDVFYYIEWGDGEIEEWIGPFKSGEEIDISHTWLDEGEYLIKAKAKDTEGFEGPWNDFDVFISPIIEIGVITGGLFSVKAMIDNLGDINLENINWSISIEGNVIFGRKTSGEDSILSGKNLIITSKYIFGFGPIKITVNAKVSDFQTVRKQSGFVFLFLIKMIPGG